MGIHDGHRQRMKERFIEHGLDNFDDINILELILFYAMPRRDVNPIAHALLDRFGTLGEVVSAPIEALTEVDGIGENAAVLLRLIPQVSRRCMISDTSAVNILNSSEKAGSYLMPFFMHQKDEVVFAVFLDAKYKVINCRKISQGEVNSAEVSTRTLVKAALEHNASAVILAHNHTSDIAIPSSDDQRTTAKLKAALAAVDITLADHIVIAADDFVSMMDSGML